MKKLALMLLLPFSVALVHAGSIEENLSSGKSLREAVLATHGSNELDVAKVFAAMEARPEQAPLVFLYSIEANKSLLPDLIKSRQDKHNQAIIDAFLVAVKFDLPILGDMIRVIAKLAPELAKEIIYAVVEVFPDRAHEIFELFAAANEAARGEFEESYTRAFAGVGREGTQRGDLYEAFEPEDDVSPS